ncbi:hypothetical protein ACI8AF_25015 [Blastococcus sp. SYSU D00669]
MSAAATNGLLFDIAPALGDVERLLTGCQRRRQQLLEDVGQCDRELRRLHALAHALRELAGESPAAAVAGRLAENGWSGSGEQLVSSARAVVAQAGDLVSRSRTGYGRTDGAPQRTEESQ